MEVWIVTANGIGDFLNLFSEVFFFLFGYKDRNVLQICLHALHLLFLYTYSKALKLSIRISKYFILLLPRVCIFSLYGLTASISNLLYLYMYTEDYTTFYCTLSPIALSCFFFFLAAWHSAHNACKITVWHTILAGSNSCDFLGGFLYDLQKSGKWAYGPKRDYGLIIRLCNRLCKARMALW